MVDHLLIRRCTHSLLILILVSIHAIACRARTEPNAMERHFDALNRMEKITTNLPDKAKARVISTGCVESYRPSARSSYWASPVITSWSSCIRRRA
jgi:hypothetical protein